MDGGNTIDSSAERNKFLSPPIRSRLLDTICAILYAREARNWKYMEIAPWLEKSRQWDK